MLIERTDKEIVIKIPLTDSLENIQDFIDYARYKEITSKFKVEQNIVDELAIEINKNWWENQQINKA